MDVTQILLNAQAVDDTLRKEAENNLNRFQEQNPPSFLLSLAGELSNDEKPLESRMLAGLVLKNALDSKQWLAMDPTYKAQIKAFLLTTLASPYLDAGTTASQVIARIAGIELPHNQWPELIESVLSNVDQQLPSSTRQTALLTIGYILEQVSPYVFEQNQVNKILTGVTRGMNSIEKNSHVRLAAIQALYKALDFAEANFYNDMERDYIMKIVCEATLSPELKIRQVAYECLVAISFKYYDKLARYIVEIFNVTAKAVREDDETIAIQAIKFWSSICEEEIDILEEYGDDVNFGLNIRCFYIIRTALPFLVPVLLETLLKQEKDQNQDQDEGAWSIAMAGATCLGLVAQTVGDDHIAPLVMPFIEENNIPHWRVILE